jgi:hypothetical protein
MLCCIRPRQKTREIAGEDGANTFGRSISQPTPQRQRHSSSQETVHVHT